MLTRIMKPRSERESGFTLIELLVVVAIIGILAAIAIPVFLNQRNTARNASVESDLRNLATVMETAYTQNGAYPTDLTALEAAGATSSEGNAIVVTPATSSFSILGCNSESGDPYLYDSAQGGFVDTTATCPTTLGITVTP